jgi:hypothetical protein
VSFVLSNLRVSKLLELNPHDNQGVRFLLHDLEEGLSWEESLVRDEESMRMLGEWKHECETRKDENTKSTKGASAHSFVSFALSSFRVSKPLELNPRDNQGVRFLLHDLDGGLSWKENMVRDEERMRMLGEWKHERTKIRKARKVHRLTPSCPSSFRTFVFQSR